MSMRDAGDSATNVTQGNGPPLHFPNQVDELDLINFTTITGETGDDASCPDRAELKLLQSNNRGDSVNEEIVEISPSPPDPCLVDSDRQIRNLLEVPVKRNVISWKDKEEFTFSWIVPAWLVGNDSQNSKVKTAVTSQSQPPLSLSSPAFKLKSSFIAESQWRLHLRAKPADGCYSVYLSLDRLSLKNSEAFFYHGFDFRIAHAQHPVRWRRSGLCKVDGETWVWGYKNLISVDELKSRYPLTVTLKIWLMKNVFEGHCNMAAISKKMHLQDEEDAAQEKLTHLWEQLESTADITFICSTPELMLSSRTSSIFISAHNSTDSVIFRAHREVLEGKCPEFLKLLDQQCTTSEKAEADNSSTNKEKNSDTFSVSTVPEVKFEPETMTAFIEFIYLTTVPPDFHEGFKKPAKLLRMAHTVGYDSLKEHCFAILSKKLSSENILPLIALAEEYQGSELLKKKLQNYFHLHEDSLKEVKIVDYLRRRNSDLYHKILRDT